MSYNFNFPVGHLSLPKSYAEAAALYDAKRARMRAVGDPKIANNTTLRPTGERGVNAYAVRLHSTDIVTFFEDGSIRLSTGGWQTFLTRNRIVECGFRCHTSNGVARVAHGDRFWTFADRMTLLPDGTVRYVDVVDPDPARVERRRKAARRKARRTGDYSDFTHCDTRGSSRWNGGNVPEAFDAPPASSPATEAA